MLLVYPPFDKSCEAGLCKLRYEMGIDCVVTGDSAEIAGHPNWISERRHPVGVSVHTPLWGRDREVLLSHLLGRGLNGRVSCVKTSCLNKTWIGRELDGFAIADLQIIRERTGLDLCGKEGEYRTLVIDGPQFRRGVDLRSYSTDVADSLAYMEIREMGLIEHAI